LGRHVEITRHIGGADQIASMLKRVIHKSQNKALL
jgi:hypothetical protein